MLEHHPPSGVGALSIGASAPQCSSHAEEGAEKNHKKVPHAQCIEMAKETAQAHPSIRTLPGSTDQQMLDITKQVY